MTESMEEKYISIEEACELLETNKDEVLELVSKGLVHAYKIGGQYIRLHKEHVGEIKAKWRINRDLFPKVNGRRKHVLVLESPDLWNRIKDFFYFNDFYIGCLIIIAALIYLIISSQ